MKVELLAVTPEPEKLIEQAGRTCYQSEVGDPTIIQRWIKSGHESVIEHSSVTFRISEISRACSHQLVRHRIGVSFSQQSQRYVSEDNFGFVIPDSIKNSSELALSAYLSMMEAIQNTYKAFIGDGIPREDARMLLPNACHTEIVVTMNFRALRNFFKLRLDRHAQWEIRRMAEAMLDIIKPIAPNVFWDIKKEENKNV